MLSWIATVAVVAFLAVVALQLALLIRQPQTRTLARMAFVAITVGFLLTMLYIGVTQ